MRSLVPHDNEVALTHDTVDESPAIPRASAGCLLPLRSRCGQCRLQRSNDASPNKAQASSWNHSSLIPCGEYIRKYPAKNTSSSKRHGTVSQKTCIREIHHTRYAFSIA